MFYLSNKDTKSQMAALCMTKKYTGTQVHVTALYMTQNTTNKATKSQIAVMTMKNKDTGTQVHFVTVLYMLNMYARGHR